MLFDSSACLSWTVVVDSSLSFSVCLSLSCRALCLSSLSTTCLPFPSYYVVAVSLFERVAVVILTVSSVAAALTPYCVAPIPFPATVGDSKATQARAAK